MDAARSQAKNAIQDEQRYQQAMAARRDQQRLEVEALEQEHAKTLESLDKRSTEQIKEAEKAYKVEFSRAVETFEKDLDQLHKGYEGKLAIEKGNQDKEFDKLRERERSRVEQYKKNQDTVVEKMHEKHQQTLEDMSSRQG